MGAEGDLETLPGFRFHPTDEELVGFYLRRKIDNKPIRFELIKDIDIYRYDPWDLPSVSNMRGEDWYFYCKRERKYRNSVRPNRVTGSGYWKATGIDKPICSDDGSCIGLKKSLVYYRGSAGKGFKTDWMMHEFRLFSLPTITNTDSTDVPTQEAEVWTLCRIFKRVKRQRQPHFVPTEKPVISLTDSCSKTSSLDSDHTSHGHGGETVIVRDHSLIHKLDETQNHCLSHHDMGLGHTVPTLPFSGNDIYFPSFWNINGGDCIADGEIWDELRPVVQGCNEQ